MPAHLMAEPRGQPLFVWGMVMVIWVAARAASPVIFSDEIPDKKKPLPAASLMPGFPPIWVNRVPMVTAAMPNRLPVHHRKWAGMRRAFDEPNKTFVQPTNSIPHIIRNDTATVQIKSGSGAFAMIAPTGAAISEKPAIPLAPATLLQSNPQPADKNWQIYAYSFWRASPGGGVPQPAAAAAQYGGSQTGIQAVYRIAGEAQSDLSLLARFTASPSGNGRSARSAREWAGGITWKPNRTVPLRITGEYRQRSNSGAVNNGAAAVYIAGGVDDVPIWQRLRVSGFSQAGWVHNFGGGDQTSSLFLDAGARIERNVLNAQQRASLSLGGGAWAGGQRGSQRLDIGPAATIKASIAGQPVQLQADWRFRIGGNASPGNGPAVTLSTGF